MAMAGLRFFLAGLIVLAYKFRHWKTIAKISWLHWLWIGLLQVVLQYSFFYIGLSFVSGMLGSIMVSTGSLWWVLLAPLFDSEEHWDIRSIPILCIGIVGVAICVSGSQAGNIQPLWGIPILICATLCNILVSLKIKPLSQKIPATVISGFSMALGGLMLMALVPKSTWWLVGKMDWAAWGLTLYLALVSAVAFSLWFLLITKVPVSKLSAYRLLIPVCGVGMSACFLAQEKLSLPFLVGGGLVIFCIRRMEGLKKK
jgi:drug/metabolite transporter (DMT)-like permease